MRIPLKGKRGPEAGLTLIELLISMIILAIVSTMLVAGWISLQRAYAFTVKTNSARATARDALDRISSELRDCQPLVLNVAGQALLTVASPMEADFYSSYNQIGASEGSGNAKLALTRIWLDTSGTKAQKTLYWQRRPLTSPISGAWTDAGVRTTKLGTIFVNNSIPNTSVTPNTTYTAIFRYAYRDGSSNILWTDNSAATLDLTKIISVQVRLICDANLTRTPTYVDLSTTLRPRNASAN